MGAARYGAKRIGLGALAADRNEVGWCGFRNHRARSRGAADLEAQRAVDWPDVGGGLDVQRLGLKGFALRAGHGAATGDLDARWEGARGAF